MAERHVIRALAAAATFMAVATTVVGCGQAPWTALSSPTSEPTPTALPTIEAVVNELAAGSVEHTSTAGDVSLKTTYWSTLSMDKWSAAANKPISFSILGNLGQDHGQAVYLSKVSVIPAVMGPGGAALPAPPAVTDTATVSPGYLVKAPYSYSQTFVMPAVDPSATSITLSFTYELLVQTTPTSSAYAKQTASDQVTIAIAP